MSIYEVRVDDNPVASYILKGGYPFLHEQWPQTYSALASTIHEGRIIPGSPCAGGYNSCAIASLSSITTKKRPSSKEEVDKICDLIFKSVKDTITVVSSTSTILMTAPCNLGCMSRTGAPRVHHYENSITLEFIHWVIENKHGIVVESPIIINASHSEGPETSLVQHFIWFLPTACERLRVMRGTGGIHDPYPDTVKFTNNLTARDHKYASFDDVVSPTIAKNPRYAKQREEWEEEHKKKFPPVAITLKKHDTNKGPPTKSVYVTGR